jgi:4-hydroxybenzoate polyprenyltransferase
VGSTAILFGEADRTILLGMQAVLILALWLTGRVADLGSWYLAGVGAAAALAGWQQYLIRRRDRDACFRAFLNNHYFGMAVFAGILLDYTFRQA